MRTATIYNFLLEANLMASIAILLMIVIRKFLRKPLGNRLVYLLWLLIAIRLLCPLALSNPWMNEFRPHYLRDQGIRPIAGQVKVRLGDAFDAVADSTFDTPDSIVFKSARNLDDGMFYGTLSRQVMWIYLIGAGVVLLVFTVSNVRFRRKLKANRIEEISGKLKEQYLAICEERGVKPVPVWFVDPLPSACLVGVVKPYIAMPLTAAPQEAAYVLAHEVCHYKGKDHWFSLLRLMCCVIHWFNPLVWLAAFMSRTDGELACDSRVVRGLSTDDRMNYTNTLVLAASKRYAPGVGVLATGMTMTGKKLQNRVHSILNSDHAVKWLIAVTAALACIALVMTFFTAEGYIGAENYLSQISGFHALGAREDGSFTDMPGAGDVDLDTALSIALKAIHEEFDLDTQSRSDFDVNIDFKEIFWQFLFYNRRDSHTYDVNINADSGKVILIQGPGNG